MTNFFKNNNFLLRQNFSIVALKNFSPISRFAKNRKTNLENIFTKLMNLKISIVDAEIIFLISWF